jgi:5-deoxy-glucuronate isomerase
VSARSLIRATGAGTLVSLAGPDADMLQELVIHRIPAGQVLEDARPLERVFLLMHGRVRFTQGGLSAEASRASLFDEAPWALQVPAGAAVAIAARDDAEIALLQTANSRSFPARIHAPRTCGSELRGAGTVAEAATRIVRTIFDDSDSPLSNLVLGEVVTLPGRWSSYPPHHHPQPEIYHYRFAPENGFGIAVVGREAFTVHTGDTILIRQGQVHPQAAAPGYAMWYLWSIRHLEANRYVTPEFEAEHAWTTRVGAPVWAPAATGGAQ